MIIDGEQVRLWKKVSVASLKRSLSFREETKEIHENLSRTDILV
jgi:hypothetical protein